MRVLLDECLPRRLKRELVGHDVRTAPEMWWASKTNGELLTLAAADFDVFLTSDRNLSHQQNLSAFNIAVMVLVAASNRIDDLRPLAPQVLEQLPTATPGAVTIVSAWQIPWSSRSSIAVHCRVEAPPAESSTSTRSGKRSTSSWPITGNETLGSRS